MSPDDARTKTVLLAEDASADARLTVEGFRNSSVRDAVRIVRDGDQVMSFLRRERPFEDAPRPDLVILDLNLPRRRGLDVLADIKGDEEFRSIPVVVLSTSNSAQDITSCYARHANCFVTKPGDLDQYLAAIAAIGDFWLGVACLPEGSR